MECIVALDDGTPVLAPYQNSTLTSYTREALQVGRQLFEAHDCDQKRECVRIPITSKNVKRAIVSLRFLDNILDLRVTSAGLAFINVNTKH